MPYFLSSPGNGVPLCFRHLFRLQPVVDLGRCFFQDSEGMDDLLRHVFLPGADGEILPAALGLCVLVGLGTIVTIYMKVTGYEKESGQV